MMMLKFIKNKENESSDLMFSVVVSAFPSLDTAVSVASPGYW